MQVFIAGGAGFIGSHCVRRLLADGAERVTVYDNLSSGRRWHLAEAANNPRFTLVEGDLADRQELNLACRGHDTVLHLASNPDIAKATTEPTIDFYQGTLLSQHVFEAARVAGVKRVIYASGSGVFGDDANRVFDENDFSPAPTSTYSASKIAGEALLSAYCHMFGLSGLSFRFANVVGPNQTHGVAYDFINRLLKVPTVLNVMGDGMQTKSYIHVDDVVSGLLLPGESPSGQYDMFNLTTDDQLTVKEIAHMVIGELGLRDVAVHYGTTSRGWVGDVPSIRFSAGKIARQGWRPGRNSREAMLAAIRGMIAHARAGHF